MGENTSLDFMLKVVMMNKPKKKICKQLFNNSEGATPLTYHLLNRLYFLGDDEYEQRYDNFNNPYEVIDHERDVSGKTAHIYIQRRKGHDTYLVHAVSFDSDLAVSLLELLQNKYFKIKSIKFDHASSMGALDIDLGEVNELNNTAERVSSAASSSSDPTGNLSRGLTSLYNELISQSSSSASSSASSSKRKPSRQSTVASVISALELQCPAMSFGVMASIGNDIADTKADAASGLSDNSYYQSLTKQMMSKPSSSNDSDLF